MRAAAPSRHGPYSSKNAVRAGGGSAHQTRTRSTAGSERQTSPQSITPDSRPSSTKAWRSMQVAVDEREPVRRRQLASRRENRLRAWIGVAELRKPLPRPGTRTRMSAREIGSTGSSTGISAVVERAQEPPQRARERCAGIVVEHRLGELAAGNAGPPKNGQETRRLGARRTPAAGSAAAAAARAQGEREARGRCRPARSDAVGNERASARRPARPCCPSPRLRAAATRARAPGTGSAATAAPARRRRRSPGSTRAPARD